MGTGMMISLIAALTFGILAARRQYGFFDNVTSFISYFGLAMPVFWFGLMLQLLRRPARVAPFGRHAVGRRRRSRICCDI